MLARHAVASLKKGWESESDFIVYRCIKEKEVIWNTWLRVCCFICFTSIDDSTNILRQKDSWVV